MDYVAALSKAGFALFPLSGKDPAIPKGTDWRQTQVDSQLTSLDLAGNYGVIVKDRLVIDVDCKNGQPGKDSFVQLTKDLDLSKGWETETFVVQSGSGGFHIYLNVPSPTKTRKHLPQYPGLEFLHGWFYVVGPGSVHPDTKRVYKAIYGSPDSLLNVPPELFEQLQQKKVETTGAQPTEGFVDDDPLNIQRFMANIEEMPEVREGGRSTGMYIVACRGREFGLSQAKCVEVLTTRYNPLKVVPPLDPREIETIVRNAYTYAQGKQGALNVRSIFGEVESDKPIDTEHLSLDTSSKGKIMASLNNAVTYMLQLPQLDRVFKYNNFSEMIEVSSRVPWCAERGEIGPSLQEVDIQMLKYFLARTVRVEFTAMILKEAVGVVAHKYLYHPIRNYLKSLVWDGVPRLDTWLSKYCGALQTIYTKEVGRKVLCAAVKRAFDPGCKWDYVMILEGNQGIGKSTVCRILGRQWGGDVIIDPHEKDTVMCMRNKWVIELSEMAALRWADANALKAFISRQVDVARLTYAIAARDIKRQSIFIGTINPEHAGYLNDSENRRYWVIHVPDRVDMVGLENVCDQLWAEAYLAYPTERLTLDGEALRIQTHETNIRRPEDPLKLNVLKWSRENREVDEVRVEDILTYMGIPLARITRGEQSRIAHILIDIGWTKQSKHIDGMWAVTYSRPESQKIERRLTGKGQIC